MLLTKNNEFHLVKSNNIGDTDIEIYVNNSETTSEVGYINEFLIYLSLTNPKIPGYNEHMKGEYFFADHFDVERQSKVALQFDIANQKGIFEKL